MPRKIRSDLDGVVTAYERDANGNAIGASYTLRAGQDVPDGVQVGEHALEPQTGGGQAASGGFDPSTANTAEVNAYLDSAGEAERARVLAAEAAGHNRKGIVEGPHGAPAKTKRESA